jgi:hypothetical protein
LALWSWGRAKARTARVMRTARLLSPLILPGFAYPLAAGWRMGCLSQDRGDRRGRGRGGVVLSRPLPRSCRRGCWWRDGCGRWARPGRACSIGRPTLSPEFILVMLGALGYAVWMGIYTIVNHRHFTTMAFDLGSYNNMFYNCPARASLSQARRCCAPAATGRC